MDGVPFLPCGLQGADDYDFTVFNDQHPIYQQDSYPQGLSHDPQMSSTPARDYHIPLQQWDTGLSMTQQPDTFGMESPNLTSRSSSTAESRSSVPLVTPEDHPLSRPKNPEGAKSGKFTFQHYTPPPARQRKQSQQQQAALIRTGMKQKTSSSSPTEENGEEKTAAAEGENPDNHHTAAEKAAAAVDSRGRSLMKNRQAAFRSRMKKKAREAQLEETMKRLERENGKLRAENARLQDEFHRARELLMRHTDCDDPNIDKWVQNEAKRIGDSYCEHQAAAAAAEENRRNASMSSLSSKSQGLVICGGHGDDDGGHDGSGQDVEDGRQQHHTGSFSCTPPPGGPSDSVVSFTHQYQCGDLSSSSFEGHGGSSGSAHLQQQQQRQQTDGFSPPVPGAHWGYPILHNGAPGVPFSHQHQQHQAPPFAQHASFYPSHVGSSPFSAAGMVDDHHCGIKADPYQSETMSGIGEDLEGGAGFN